MRFQVAQSQNSTYRMHCVQLRGHLKRYLFVNICPSEFIIAGNRKIECSRVRAIPIPINRKSFKYRRLQYLAVIILRQGIGAHAIARIESVHLPSFSISHSGSMIFMASGTIPAQLISANALSINSTCKTNKPASFNAPVTFPISSLLTE